jgi:hypothetical protein
MVRRFLLLAACLILVAVPASAQSVWLDREHRPSVLGEVLFPNFEGDGTEFPTWAWFVAGKLPVGSGTSVVLELPYAHGDIGDGSGSSAGSIGNPYVGFDYQPKPSGLVLEGGLRLPLQSDEEFLPILVGLAADVDRWEAFWPEVVPVRIGIHYHHAPSGTNAPIAWDLRVAPTVWIPTEDQDTEFFIGYGGTVRYQGADARIGAGLTGRWLATNDDADFGESSSHQIDLAADFLHGSVRPGLQMKVPLDDGLFLSSVDYSWGLTLTVLP